MRVVSIFWLPADSLCQRLQLIHQHMCSPLGRAVHCLQALDCCVEIPQGGVVRSLNVHVSGAIAVYEYVRRHGFS